MDIVRILHKEEKKLIGQRDSLDLRVKSLRTAINALNGNSDRPGPRAGRKLSAAHKKAIRDGIARRKAGKSKSEK